MKPLRSPRLRATFGILAAVLALAGCPGEATPYVTLVGYVIPPRAAQVSPTGARVDLSSVKGDLGKAEVARLSAVGSDGTLWSYSVQLDATVLPQNAALFKVVVRNPEKAPRDTALLSSLVALSRPPGKGPELASVRADIDATSSIAALGIEYRVNMDPEGDFQGVDPVKAGAYLGRNTLLLFNFINAYGSFVAAKNNDSPATSLDIAQQASEDLPPDLKNL